LLSNALFRRAGSVSSSKAVEANWPQAACLVPRHRIPPKSFSLETGNFLPSNWLFIGFSFDRENVDSGTLRWRNACKFLKE
jgi:hypothetical protein